MLTLFVMCPLCLCVCVCVCVLFVLLFCVQGVCVCLSLSFVCRAVRVNAAGHWRWRWWSCCRVSVSHRGALFRAGVCCESPRQETDPVRGTVWGPQHTRRHAQVLAGGNTATSPIPVRACFPACLSHHTLCFPLHDVVMRVHACML